MSLEDRRHRREARQDKFQAMCAAGMQGDVETSQRLHAELRAMGMRGWVSKVLWTEEDWARFRALRAKAAGSEAGAEPVVHNA